VQPHDALIVFSRKMVYLVAEELRERGWSVSMIYGDLPYDVRHKEAAKFIKGESQVLVSTDAIGLGLNLPIKRVVFLKTVKFDGYSMRPLTAGEVKQIGGRAGRFGIYNEGYVCAEGDNDFIAKRIYADTPEIEYATIQFPETIIDIDAPMLDILLRWKDITVNAGYRKADIEREIKLCKMLEPVIENKMFIYTAITTPFDEKEKTLLDLWYDMVVAEYRKESLLEEIFDIYSVKFSKKLDKLELTYHIFDLLYNFSIKFNHSELSDRILRKKTQLSDEIIYRMSLFEKNKKHT
ncbi:MAG: helicase, partial [Lachnospiraceae bacterium]|nr:helicase [Lachnospiraceae bacterium]